MKTKTIKISKRDLMAQFVAQQHAFVKALESREFVAVPHLQIGHNKTLAEARELLNRAEVALAAL